MIPQRHYENAEPFLLNIQKSNISQEGVGQKLKSFWAFFIGAMSIQHITVPVLFWAAVFTFVPQWVWPDTPGKVLESDTNGDGRTDQAAHLGDGGDLVLLEIDSNTDGRFDRFQHYLHGAVSRIESDSNHDGKIDAKDYFEKGQRVRHEGPALETGRLEVLIHFDRQERLNHRG